ncbi:MAG: alpha/beta hydrolase [Proteobacteria bacterium]|nr:alpha/beta hydrolase [Pseudomonadota bacterium]
MPFTKVESLDVHYETQGRGDLVVMLHHGFGSSKIWKALIPDLVGHGYRVLVYDRRGYGRSEAGADFSDFFSSERYRPESVRELAGLVENLGLEPFHLVAQCEGGVVGVDFAAACPDQVRSLAFSSTLCFSGERMDVWNQAAFAQRFDQLDEAFRDKMISWHGRDRAGEFYDQAMRRGGGGAYGLGVFDLRPDLAKVGCRTLVLYPDRSGLFGVEQGVAHYRNLGQGELSVLPRCGHHTYEQPEIYCREILAFWDRCRSVR